jgi:hypothetical protein
MPRLEFARPPLWWVALSLVLLAMGTFPVAAATPRLNLKPSHGLAGETVVASGRNFSPGVEGQVVWSDEGTALANFRTDAAGDFQVEIVIPDATPGRYAVAATAGSETATDALEIDAPERSSEEDAAAAAPLDPMPGWMQKIAMPPMENLCPAAPIRRIEVGDAEGLTTALAAAVPGDVIALAAGTYHGTFVADRSGSAESPIWLCGSRDAVIDGGDFGNGYALHITADHVGIQGITITNALKGVMLDDADFAVLAGIEVHTTGHEAVHFRAHSADNVVRDSDIHNTGLKRDKFGEGIYLGSAVSNWGNYSEGEPDRSDRIQVLNNRIWDVTSEAIDIKEGTTGGLIEGNLMDGSELSGADSWIDAKGSGYLIRNNHGQNASGDGYQTHVINDMAWGSENIFEANTAVVNSDGFGFYIHDPETSGNTVRCSNEVIAAGSGFANVPCV